MSDWTDFLEGLSGGFMGVTKGLTAGAEPFNAWETVRGKDLANDLSDVKLRDAQLTQGALENPDLGFYGNLASAKDVGNRVALSKGNSDIFGLDRNLSLQQYLMNPDFQRTVAGLDPGDPEYRTKVAAAMAQYDPQNAIGVYDKYNVRGLEQQNLNEQTTLRFLEQYAQHADPGAKVVRMPDGSVQVIGSDGMPTPVPASLLTKIAAMMAAPKSPYDAISQGLGDEIKIQTGNSNVIKALQTGQITPQQAVQYIGQQRQQINSGITAAVSELRTLQQSTAFATQDPDTLARVEQLQTKIAAGQQAMEKLNTLTQQITLTGRIPAQGGSAVPFTGPPRPQGGATLTTRPTPAAIAQRAAGGAGGNIGLPAIPRASGGSAPFMSNRDTGVQPITQGPTNDALGAFLQLMGIE